MKKLLFVINTLGRAGAEVSLLELLRNIDPTEYEISLFVLASQGELICDVPDYVRVLNEQVDGTPVLSREGTRRLIQRLIVKGLKKGALMKRSPYLIKNAVRLWKDKKFSCNKLTRCLLSDVAERFDEEYDLAVAFLEGGASFYVDSYVKAKKKVAFIHVDYDRAGYSRYLDEDCYMHYDWIFTVSDEVRESFLRVYPECAERTSVFHNIINVNRIRECADKQGGFSDDYKGFRILTVGRLYMQKAYDISIRAMKLLKEEGYDMRWYVLGEGEERENLELLIHSLGLEEDFVLLGQVENPYPYLAQTDLYVHASKYEGKSVAVQEAQVLGKPIIVSDCAGNREQVVHGKTGVLCPLTPEDIMESILTLYKDDALRTLIANNAAGMVQTGMEELEKLWSVMNED